MVDMTEATPLASEQITQFGPFRLMETWDQRDEAVLLLVDYQDGDHPLDDARFAITIGHNNDHNVGDGEGQGWRFAGWCWSHDHYVEGRGKPVGWMPIPHILARAYAAFDGEPAALSASPAPSGQGVSGEDFSWSFNTETRDIEFGASPVFKVYEASDFPCLEDDERAEADDWYDAQAQTAVLMLNSLLHTDDEPVAAPAPSCAPGEVGALAWISGYAADFARNPDQPTNTIRNAFTAIERKAAAALSPQGLDAKEGEQVVCATCHSGRECDCGQRLDAATVEREDAALVADANAWYSSAQIEEMQERAERLRKEIRRCTKVIEGGKADPWWKEDRDRYTQELRELEAALATEPHQHGDNHHG